MGEGRPRRSRGGRAEVQLGDVAAEAPVPGVSWFPYWSTATTPYRTCCPSAGRKSWNVVSLISHGLKFEGCGTGVYVHRPSARVPRSRR